MKKIILSILITSGLFFTSIANCLAIESQNSSSFLYGDSNAASEISEIQDSIVNNNTLGASDENLEIQKGYKVYWFKGHDIVRMYRQAGNVDALIDYEQYTWQIPTSTGNVATVIPSDVKGEWKVAGIAEFDDAVETASKSVVDKDTLKCTISKQISDVKDFKYVISHYYHTTFAYVKSGNQEYLIPYGSRPDLTGLENGKVYQPGSVMDILEETMGLPNAGLIAADGGAGGTDTLWTVVVSIVLTVVIVLLFWVWHRKNVNSGN